MNNNNAKIERLLAKRADHKTMHWLHFVVSFLTAGLWIPFWIGFGVYHMVKRGGIDRQLEAMGE